MDCIICKENFNLMRNQPVQLPCCSETICRPCQLILQSPQQGKQFICPIQECRQLNNSNAIFKPNKGIERILMKQLAIFCDEHLTNHVNRLCESCNEYMCSECGLEPHSNHIDKVVKVDKASISEINQRLVGLLLNEQETLAQSIDKLSQIESSGKPIKASEYQKLLSIAQNQINQQLINEEGEETKVPDNQFEEFKGNKEESKLIIGKILKYQYIIEKCYQYLINKTQEDLFKEKVNIRIVKNENNEDELDENSQLLVVKIIARNFAEMFYNFITTTWKYRSQLLAQNNKNEYWEFLQQFYNNSNIERVEDQLKIIMFDQFNINENQSQKMANVHPKAMINEWLMFIEQKFINGKQSNKRFTRQTLIQVIEEIADIIIKKQVVNEIEFCEKPEFANLILDAQCLKYQLTPDQLLQMVSSNFALVCIHVFKKIPK